MAAGRYRDDQDVAVAPAQRNDAYTGMLIISLAAMVLGCILLLIEFFSYDRETKPPAVNLPAPAARSAPSAPAGVPGAPGMPGAPGTPPPAPPPK